MGQDCLGHQNHRYRAKNGDGVVLAACFRCGVANPALLGGLPPARPNRADHVAEFEVWLALEDPLAVVEAMLAGKAGPMADLDDVTFWRKACVR